MSFLSNLNISTRVMLYAVTVSIAMCAMIIGTAYISSSRSLKTAGKAELNNIANNIYNMCVLQTEVAESKTKSDYEYANLLMSGLADNPDKWGDEITFNPEKVVKIGSVDLPEMKLNEVVLSNNLKLVDQVAAQTGSTCTIFQKDGTEYYRVATNVKKPDGSRAVGTKLNKKSPAYEKVEKGEGYLGVTKIQGKNYVTIYEPIMKEGNVIGILYVGSLLSQFESLMASVDSIVVAETGYVFLMNEEGILIQHPDEKAKGKNISELDFTKQMFEMKDQVATESKVLDYDWENRGKYMAVRYYPEYKWYIGVTTWQSEIDAASTKMGFYLLILGVISMVVVSLIFFFVGRSIAKPVITVSNAIKELANGDGDLTKRLPVKSSNETGQLASNFNVFITVVHDLVSKVADSASQVASGAQEIASTNQNMLQSVEDQSSQTSQVASAVEEMAAAVVEVANKSMSVSSNAAESGNTAKDGGTVVSKTVDSIRTISVKMQDTTNAVEDLGKRSDEIGDIIDVINDIADQTNLLALNAAIEAARAGDAGRGFAVVADEVRKLAERTSKATEEVSDSIAKIQTETSIVVQQMTDAYAEMNTGVEQAEQAGQSLESIVAETESVAREIMAIAASTEQQSATVEQISKSIDNIDAGSRQTNQGVQQASDAAESLSRQATSLQDLVGQFKI